MQTVPSLIGAGTAVATAATGLVFGQLADGQPPPSPSPSPNSSNRKSIPEQGFLNAFPSSSSRPDTRNSAVAVAPVVTNDEPVQSQYSAQQFPPTTTTTNPPRIPRRSSNVQITPPKLSSLRHSYVRQAPDFVPNPTIVEDSRDSFSSNGSWMRRLSIRPRSQHESLRSSVGPDSPSIFSFGSAAPILPSAGTEPPPPQLPPNKLVKRASATNGVGDAGFLARRGSRPQVTLRRPATSHQRSATLHQQINTETLSPLPQFPLEQYSRPRSRTVGVSPEPVLTNSTDEPFAWKSFWHSRITRGPFKGSPLRGSDSSVSPSAKRICVEQKSRRRVYLVAPNSVMMSKNNTLQVPTADTAAAAVVAAAPSEPETRVDLEDSPESSDKPPASPEGTPSKQLRRSISMHFSSPTNWMSKTGSIRRRKRGETTGGSNGNKRHVSAPVATDADSTQVGERTDPDGTRNDADLNRTPSDLAAVFRPPDTDRRSTSSPLPPLPRLSSFHIDLNCLGPSSSASDGRVEESVVSSSTTLRVNSNASQARTLEGASTVASSDYHRGFTSGDDDDTDFKTDTPFDSLRTVASGQRRTLDSPLESMFDESPPSTAGNNTKPKRLSIQEILGPSFDGGNKIMEEDESIPTPVRGKYDGEEAHFRVAGIDDDEDSTYRPTTSEYNLDRDYSRLSLDDDDDLDWARDDDVEIFHHLSPPGSMNSRGGSPNLRLALGCISGNRKSDSRLDCSSERPRSTVFDWTERPVHDKHDDGRLSYRPKTVHGKQELDIRGGRSASRKGPTAAHVRSQSVPVVADQTETAKSTPKFGTWGLGQKNVSEDWDDDFEFEEQAGIGPIGGKKDENRFSMVVPASIQATQPTVKAHSGQIRELSLLVNDLKRLCRLGREMDMLNGPSSKLWREAEGIIALASPDEDAAEDREHERTSEDDARDSVDARFIDQGFDGASLDELDSSGIPENKRTAVVRDRLIGRRRSVFSPEDDIFGTWDQVEDEETAHRPRTPENRFGSNETASARSVMEVMQSRHARPNMDEENESSNGRLNFDTNSLKELVKRASDLRDGLSDLVRRADHITSSPVRTPKRTRADGSPAFTRVFDEPSSSPTRRITHTHSNNSVLNSSSVGASPSNGLGQRMQMMTVS